MLLPDVSLAGQVVDRRANPGCKADMRPDTVYIIISQHHNATVLGYGPQHVIREVPGMTGDGS